MSQQPITTQSTVAPSAAFLVLELNQIDDLFDAPAANPFSTHPVDVLGTAGVDHVVKQIKRQWPRRAKFERLVIQLPQGQVTPGLSNQTAAALQSYCAQRIAENQDLRRLSTSDAWHELWIAGAVTLLAIVMLALLVSGALDGLAPFVRGILVVLSLLAASLAIWDALESLFFDWPPFVIDNRAYRLLSALDVVVEEAK